MPVGANTMHRLNPRQHQTGQSKHERRIAFRTMCRLCCTNRYSALFIVSDLVPSAAAVPVHVASYLPQIVLDCRQITLTRVVMCYHRCSAAAPDISINGCACRSHGRTVSSTQAWRPAWPSKSSRHVFIRHLCFCRKTTAYRSSAMGEMPRPSDVLVLSMYGSS